MGWRISTSIAVMLAAGCAGSLAMGTGAAMSSVLDCGSLSAGTTVLSPGKGGGAACLLRAYQQHCRPAVYELSMFGVDTIARENFRLVRERGGCRIKVATSFTVVPQKPRPGARGECSTLRARGTDVVAGGCVGSGLPRSFSLTGKH
jgi:hypothetical protein